jgi:excisionase family DNA binding protein
VRAPDLLTKRQAADYLQVSVPTINNYLRRGLLRAYKLPGGRLVRIKREDLLALLEETPA